MVGTGTHTTTVERPSSRRRRREPLSAALFVLAVSLCWPISASAWWNEEWALRKQITLDTSSSGANITEPIGFTPVLVRLHVGNFRFGQAKEDGSDLRFVAADDKTPLQHHIEKFDSLLGEAFVWVNVPNIKPGSKETFWLYYDNKNAKPVNDAKGTYDPDMVLVYHFATRGAPPQDSSQWANHAGNVGQSVDGAIIGAGLHLDGTVPLTVPGSPSLASAQSGAFTWSAWIKPASLQRNAAIYSRGDGTNGLVIGIDDGSPYVEIAADGNIRRSSPGAPVAPNGWHHLAVTATPGQVTVYLDGNVHATLDATLPPLDGAAGLGGVPPAGSDSAGAAANEAEATTPAATGGFAGDIDEVQISKVARPAGFVKFAATGQGPDPGRLIAYGTDEETSSWSSGYFGVILQSVTLDGWVVIGLLMIMAVVSWVVMIGKAIYIHRQSKANAEFKRHFRQIAGNLEVLVRCDAHHISSLAGRIDPKDRDVARYSSLYRLYLTGVTEIRSRFADTDAARVLSSQSIAAIRSALDGGFIGETQRLNSFIVLLTLAISGGPFLGLLGTVVGVMITFAAIAASGDVNVNAIAPGIAAALVATVAGLGVAIPALFGYNYLLSRIKDLSADMQIFVDEFTTKMAEDFDSPAGRQPRSLAAE